MLQGQPYSQPADVYSFAMCMYEIFTQDLPWNEVCGCFLSFFVVVVVHSWCRGRRRAPFRLVGRTVFAEAT